MHIINANYGNHSIALIQWAFQRQLSDTYVVSVDTGWSASNWNLRVEAGEQLARNYGFKVIRLKCDYSFEALVRDRVDFPSIKFQWCATFLKGLPLLNWLEKVDPECQATILLGKRKLDSRLNHQLRAFEASSPHYGDRQIWHPLLNCPDDQFFELIAKTSLDKLDHRSLECDPCVHSTLADLSRLQPVDSEKLKHLEDGINKTLFSLPIKEMQVSARQKAIPFKKMESFYMGCGQPFGCGE